MANLLPHLIDMPMSLGDHLHELRKRLMVPLAILASSFIAAFIYQNDLKKIYLDPLFHAMRIAGPEVCAKAGLHVVSPDQPYKILESFDFSESAMVSMSVSFYAALAVAIPVLVYQAWKFISVGLVAKERRLAFLFVPAGIMFFYSGALLGYFYGIAYYYAWMIEWAANDPTTTLHLRQSSYNDSFVLMTVCFGLIMDIPWLVMVLVRVGLVTPDQLGKYRKFVVMINTVVASLITPPDGTSMLVMMVPLQLLFEGGLLASRLMMWRHQRIADEEEAQRERNARQHEEDHRG